MGELGILGTRLAAGHAARRTPDDRAAIAHARDRCADDGRRADRRALGADRGSDRDPPAVCSHRPASQLDCDVRWPIAVAVRDGHPHLFDAADRRQRLLRPPARASAPAARVAARGAAGACAARSAASRDSAALPVQHAQLHRRADSVERARWRAQDAARSERHDAKHDRAAEESAGDAVSRDRIREALRRSAAWWPSS